LLSLAKAVNLIHKEQGALPLLSEAQSGSVEHLSDVFNPSGHR
jgi:hypothetical protein